MAIIKVITPSVTDANITTAKVTDNAITLAKMASGTDGNIISYDASGNPVAIATGSDGQVLTSTGAGSPPAFETPASATNTPYFYAYLNSNQTFGTTTSTKIAFGHETLDSANGFNVSNHEYTIPSGQGGKWWIFFQVRRAGFAGDRFFADMYSGSTALLSAESNGGSDSYDTTSGAGLFDLAAGDVLKVEAYHTDSGNRSINGQAKSTFFGGYKLIT